MGKDYKNETAVFTDSEKYINIDMYLYEQWNRNIFIDFLFKYNDKDSIFTRRCYTFIG